MHEWIPKDCFSGVHINDFLFVETLCHLPEDFLIRNDRLGMHFPMEGRFPLTMNSFKQYALAISPKHKFISSRVKPNAVNCCKQLSKRAYKNHLPDYIIDKFKTGWAIPPSWMKSKKFRKKKDSIFSTGYHESTDELFNLKDLRADTGMRTMMTALYFRIWAQKFQITL